MPRLDSRRTEDGPWKPEENRAWEGSWTGGLLGGIVVFVWGYVAHTVLPLGSEAMTMLSEAKSSDIVQSLGADLPGSGMYLLPSTTEQDPESEEYKSFAESYEQGPTAFVRLPRRRGEADGRQASSAPSSRRTSSAPSSPPSS